MAVNSASTLPIGTVSGISVSVTFVVFSLGAMMGIVCMHLCHISRQKHKTPVISPTSTDVYDLVGPTKTQKCIVEMVSNTSYGVPLSLDHNNM